MIDVSPKGCSGPGQSKKNAHKSKDMCVKVYGTPQILQKVNAKYSGPYGAFGLIPGTDGAVMIAHCRAAP